MLRMGLFRVDNLDADFTIETNNLEAEYSLNSPETFACSFELFASGTTWGSIDGELSNQIDLWEILQSKADTVTVESLSDTVTNNYNDLDGRISSDHSEITNIALTIQSYGDIVSYNAADFATAAQGALADTAVQSITTGTTNGTILVDGTAVSVYGLGSAAYTNSTAYATSIQGGLADSAIQPNDNISELNNDAGYITSSSLPTVNNGTLTIQVNGSDIATFTANQSGDTTANITITGVQWGNITGTLSDQTDLQNALNIKVTNNATGNQAIALGQSSKGCAV